MTQHTDDNQTDNETFWENRYKAGTSETSGKPGKMLEKYVSTLTPGTVLELGCGKGDDVAWMAKNGWTVLAVDISATALQYTMKNATRAGVADSIRTERHDLALTFPEGEFELVTANFLQTPVEFPRTDVLKRATHSVAPGGHFLIIEHGARTPWSNAPEDMHFPSAEETFSSLELDDEGWSKVVVDAITREATSPQGEKVDVLDNVILLRRQA